MRIRCFLKLPNVSAWGLAALAYVEKIRRDGDDFQIRPLKRGIVWEGASFDVAIQELLRDQASPGGEIDVAAYFGTVRELVDLVDVESPVGGASVAFTWHNEERLPRAYARSLNRFSMVGTPTEELAERLRDLRVRCARCVPIPRVSAPAPLLGPNTVGKGTNLGFANTEEELVQVLLAYEKDGPLTLVSKFDWTIDPDSASIALLRKLLDDDCEIEIEDGHCLQHPSTVVGAARLGARILNSDPVFSMLVSSQENPTMPWREAIQEERKRVNYQYLPAAVVMTNKNRRYGQIEEAARAAVADLRPEGYFVLVDQGSDEDVVDEERTLLKELTTSGAHIVLVHSEPPEGNGWSLSSARNAGARYAVDNGCHFLAFIDNDVVLPRTGLLRMILNVSAQGSVPHDTDAVTIFVNEDRGNGGATGIMAIKRGSFVALNGFDETFAGYGAEDTDFLGRLKIIGGVWNRDASIVATHLPHPPSKYTKSEMYERNKELAFASIRGVVREVNPDGWGAYEAEVIS